MSGRLVKLAAVSFLVSLLLLLPTLANAANVRDFGAAGDGVSDDTAAFQAAWNAAVTTHGTLFVPAANPGKCYVVTGINGTNISNVTVAGDGPGSCIYPATTGNWWDLTGSSHVRFFNLAVNGDGTHTPAILFLWAASATSVNPVVDLSFRSVDINARSSNAHVYAFAEQRLSVSGSTWIQTYNGTTPTNRSLATTVLQADALNSKGVSSANTTILATTSVASSNTITATVLADNSVSGTNSNNTAFNCVNCGSTTVRGGKITSMGTSDVVLWHFAESIGFYGTELSATDGSANRVKYWVETGGGVVGDITIAGTLLSNAASGGAVIGVNPASGGSGGLSELVILPNGVGGNTNSVPLIGYIGTCTPPGDVVNPWIDNSDIDAQGLNIVACGNIENTFIRKPGTNAVPAGSHDYSSGNGRSKVVAFSRDLTTASGTQSITGVGFAPAVCHFMAVVNTTPEASIGFSDADRAGSAMYNMPGSSSWTYSFGGSIVIQMNDPSNGSNNAAVQSYDANGFTLNWTKNGLPTGTANITALCQR